MNIIKSFIRMFKTDKINKEELKTTIQKLNEMDEEFGSFTSHMDEILLDETLTRTSKSYRIDKRQGRKPKSYVTIRK